MSSADIAAPGAGLSPLDRAPQASTADAAQMLILRGISKHFHGVKALEDVAFSLRRGEIVSLVGQNGAGKSTLMSIIGGILQPDEGEIQIDGRPVRIPGPAIAEKLGIGLVHQEPTLVRNMSIAANVFLNREPLKHGVLLDFGRMNAETRRVLESLGFSLDPERRVESLTLVEKEAVEIAKAMLLEPRILILDEVTAPLNADEVEHLFRLIGELKAKGIGIIFISHRLSEIVRLSDRIVVLRDGRNAGDLLRDQRPAEKDIIQLMLDGAGFCAPEQIVGGDVDATRSLSVAGLSRRGHFADVSLEVRAGEIVGLAGLKGSGITELMKCLFGTLRADKGEVRLHGEPIDVDGPHDAIRCGIGMITNDRQREGLALRRSVDENVTISSLDQLSNRLTFFRRGRLREVAARFVAALEIRTPSVMQEVINLSGGNQQKVAIAKWLLRDLPFLLVDEPTRGVDVKAQAEIHRLLVDLRRTGKGLLVASPEITELMSICDRILIISSGRIASEVQRGTPQFNQASILEVLHVGPHRMRANDPSFPRDDRVMEGLRD
ncbi:MAG: sugar ABC transporter ATP-binding protein [Burkholderiaceae bacterium]|nr:sugar ABC transporter ATP-binding protein [Burkholderiaceae bacterium]